MLPKTIVILFLTCLFQNKEATLRMSPKLVIDHDGGADDAMAITMCLRYETYFHGPEVIALTTTFGNVNLSQVIINSGRILDVADRKLVPIYVGANQPLINGIESDYFFGKDGLGDDGYVPRKSVQVEKEHAAVALVELSKTYKGQLIIVAIGPLTNIALAARLDPSFMSRLKHLYIGGGKIYDEQNPSPPEFNAIMDPEAYHIVANTSTQEKVTFVPFPMRNNSLSITKEWRKNVLGSIQTPLMEALNGFERVSQANKTNWTLLDPVVAAVALNSSVIKEIRNSSNNIILCGDKRGITTNDFTNIDPNCQILYKTDENVYKQFLVDIYSAELK